LKGPVAPFADPAARRRLLDLLADGARLIGVGLPSAAAGRLIDYLALLHKWNAAYSLTAVEGGEQMVVRLLLDSLSVVPYIKGPRVLDLGSGPGLPGIPLALILTGCDVVLLDSSLKKTRFLRQAVGELGLANVAVEQGRAEDYRPPRPFDTVVTRAFGTLADIVAVAGHLCARQGRICAMKGRYPRAELDDLPPGWRAEAVERLKVPGLDAERYLIRLMVRDS
jgi:16S rRNA (guanine527-N7)-methyltransferase